MKHSIALLLLVAGLAVAACGESEQDKASTKVCDARADVKKQVDELRGLTLTTATVDGVTANLKAIRTDLGKIADAQGSLSDDRKKQVQSANQAFKAQMTSLAASVGKSLSLADAESQVRTALAQLSDSYKKTLGQINCG
jgi:uncharacterized membrane-anchored protein YjiN (DUF445 family)